MQWLALGYSALAAASAQMLFKLSASNGWGGLISLSGILAFFFYGTGFLAFYFALKTIPLNIAYQSAALTYVIVCLISCLFLGEQIVLRQILGMGVVVAGIILILA